MTEIEAEDFIRKVENGLKEAQYNMLKEKALHDDYVIISSHAGEVQRIPAKSLIVD